MKWPPLKMGILLAVLAVGGGGYVAYDYWTKTPQYALQQITMAYQSHDYPLFARYVDLDTLIPRTVDTLIESTLESTSRRHEASWATNLTKGLTELLKPQMTSWIKERLAKMIETGDFTAKGKSATPDKPFAEGLEKSIAGRQFDGLRLEKIDYDGKLAFAHIRWEDKGDQETVVLRMRQAQDGNWQVIDIANLHDLLIKPQIKKEPKQTQESVSGPSEEKEGLRYAKDFVRIDKVRVGTGIRYGIIKEESFFGTLINAGARTVTSLTVRVYFLDAKGQRIGEVEYSPLGTTPLRPGYRRDFGYSVKSDAPSGWGHRVEAGIIDATLAELEEPVPARPPAVAASTQQRTGVSRRSPSNQAGGNSKQRSTEETEAGSERESPTDASPATMDEVPEEIAVPAEEPRHATNVLPSTTALKLPTLPPTHAPEPSSHLDSSRLFDPVLTLTLDVTKMPTTGKSYFRLVEQRIRSTWTMPLAHVPASGLLTLLRVRFERNGTISSIRMERSSGNDYYDLAAKRALLNINMLPAFPGDYETESVETVISFAAEYSAG